MRIGILSTRLSGTDGVSLEVEKWVKVFQKLGHEVYYCAGELGGYAKGGTCIPELSFSHPWIDDLNKRAFGPFSDNEVDVQCVINEIILIANYLYPRIHEFIKTNRIELIVVQNAFAIPMNLPLGVCLSLIIADLGLPTIAQHHDFYWERTRYQASRIQELLDVYFPPDLASIRHVTINSIAQRHLLMRRNLDSVIIPNVIDFSVSPGGKDAYNADLRQALNLRYSDKLFLQPTRVIQRKGIELAIEMAARINIPQVHLLITHKASDEGLSYWQWIKKEAEIMGVNLMLIDSIVHEKREQVGDNKIYSLWDVYPHADLVTYPSLYEGFGNALLEAIYFKRLILVNRYPVFVADIEPLGFEFIKIDGFVSQESIDNIRQLLDEPGEVEKMAKINYDIAQAHFSTQVLERKLVDLMNEFV